MEVVAIILAAVVLGAAGIAWDYYKPSRFRTSYRNANNSNDNHYGDLSDGGCGDGGSD